VHGCALNITVQSYDQLLEFGLVADAHALPDLRLLADGIDSAMTELRALAPPKAIRETPAVAPKPPGRKARR
jgi:diacylglycerol O-acyltransferase / wax synthase